MARKRKRDSQEQMEDTMESSPESAPGRVSSLRGALRFAGLTVALVVSVFGAAWTVWQSEQFLTRDPRFHIPTEEEDREALRIHGQRNASLATLRRVFEPDRGRSLFELNAEKRRLQLRTVEWVRDASVRRIWPNRVAVEVVERQPVAFIKMPAGASGLFEDPISYQPMLIDADGIILPVRGSVPEGLPLFTGVPPREDVEVRRTRVRRAMAFLKDIGEYRARVSEISVARIDNLRIHYQIEGREVVLLVGGELYRERIELFLRNWEKARESVQPGDVLDVTLDDRIVIKRAGSGIR